MTSMTTDKEAALRKGVLAFETSMADWMPVGAPKTLSVRVFDAAAPARQDHGPGDAETRQYERLPDVVLVSCGAGPKPDHWDARQTDDNTVHIYTDAVEYDRNYIDTTFMRGHTCRVLTFNGLLRARYESALLTGLSRRLHGQRRAVPEQSNSEAGSVGKGKLKDWLASNKARAQNPREKALAGRSPGGLLRQELSQRLDEVLRGNRDILTAQLEVWGVTDPTPTVWFPSLE